MSRLPLQVLVYLHCAGEDGRPRYLLLLRNPDRVGIWQGVTGGVEEGETLARAAAREVREETGFRLGGEGPLPFCGPFTFRLEEPYRRFYPGHDQVTEHRFHAEVERRDPTLDPAEHVEFRWCTLDEAIDLLHWPSNRAALADLDRLLRSIGR